MNANRLISMAINMIFRRLMRSGINAGMDAMAKRKKGQGPDVPKGQGQSGGPDTRELQNRVRKTMRLGRRIGRF